MPTANDKILQVPTNLITGFLGVGKTSAILNLMQQKPSNERWAVLINEFGEIGVDGSLVSGQSSEAQGIYISEVPGGCMCCSAGLPMQIALNFLLRKARPHRLLVEPTGLGHPVEVLQALSAENYREVLSLQRTITLVDARNLSDDRYITHTTFLQQLEIADVIVANKEDLYTAQDQDNLASLPGQYIRPEADLIVTRYGRVDLKSLQGPAGATFESRSPHRFESGAILAAELPFPECGYITAVNSGEGFESIGWRFHPAIVFDRARLISFLTGLQAERLKAVFITCAGVFAYNMTRDTLDESKLDDCMESRIEIIAETIDLQWQNRLLACVV